MPWHSAHIASTHRRTVPLHPSPECPHGWQCPWHRAADCSDSFQYAFHPFSGLGWLCHPISIPISGLSFNQRASVFGAPTTGATVGQGIGCSKKQPTLPIARCCQLLEQLRYLGIVMFIMSVFELLENFCASPPPAG